MSLPNPSIIQCEVCGEAPDELSDKIGTRKLCTKHRQLTGQQATPKE